MSLQVTNNSQIQDVIQGVQQKYEESLRENSGKIKASSGLLIFRSKERGIELLLGKLNKPGSVENVHGTFATFSGKVEAKDFANPSIPGVIAAAAREAEEETQGLIQRSQAIHQLSQETTRCVKNAGWKNFCAPVFITQIDVSDSDIAKFNGDSKSEMSELKWLPLNDILDAQKRKDRTYNDALQKLEQEAGKPLTEEEKFKNAELSSLYKVNPQLSSGDVVAHYVARTILLAENLFPQK